MTAERISHDGEGPIEAVVIFGCLRHLGGAGRPTGPGRGTCGSSVCLHERLSVPGFRYRFCLFPSSGPLPPLPVQTQGFEIKSGSRSPVGNPKGGRLVEVLFMELVCLRGRSYG